MTTTDYVGVLPSSIQLCGLERTISLVIVDAEDGLLLNQVEEIFGYSQFEMRQAMKALGLSSRKISGLKLGLLQDEGLIVRRATQATFVPRDAIHCLIKHMGTNEDLQIYKSIWAPLKPDQSRYPPRRNFKVGVIRCLRKLHEDRRQDRREIDELRQIVEDLMRQDMNRCLSALSAAKVSLQEQGHYSGTGVSNFPRCQFPNE
jgi:hypothetical protein